MIYWFTGSRFCDFSLHTDGRISHFFDFFEINVYVLLAKNLSVLVAYLNLKQIDDAFFDGCVVHFQMTCHIGSLTVTFTNVKLWFAA